MPAAEQSLPFACPKCWKAGAYVFEKPHDSFWQGPTTFISLTEGFTYRSDGEGLPKLRCESCHVWFDINPAT